MIDLENRILELRKLTRQELIERASRIQPLHHRNKYEEWDNEEIIQFVARGEELFKIASSKIWPKDQENFL